jgi:parallel beta-helix repeat protein
MKSNVNVVGTDTNWNYVDLSHNDYPTIHNDSRAPVWLLFPLYSCRLANLKITGGKMEQGQVYVSGFYGEINNDVVIEKCWFYQGSHVGIMLRGAAAPTIKDCLFEDPRTSCISSFLYGIQPASTPMIIQGCELSGNLTGYGDGWGLRAGINLSSQNEGNFDILIGGDGALANHIHHMGRAGIRLEDLGSGCDITIDNNEINNNSDGQYGLYAPGIRVDDVSKVTITRNTIHDNMQAGIAIATNSDVTIGAESSVTGDIADIQNQYGNDIYGNYAGVAFGLKKTKPSNGTFVIRGNQIYSNKFGTGGGIAVTREVLGTILIKQNVITDNHRGGIGIQDDCNVEIVQNRIYNQYQRAGIHTGRNGQNWFGVDGGGGAILTIRQNKIYGNLNVSRGGGIDVRHASGTIENNLVYDNGRAGIRFGDWMDEILNNTVVNNGNDTNNQGGGIIYDELDDIHTDPPSGVPPAPLLILNNISAHNQKAGIRACFDNTPGFEERDYNLVYSNNGTGETDCGYPDSLNKRCANKNFGGCGDMWNPIPPPRVILDGPNNIIANPLFKNMVGNNYRLQRLSEGDSNNSPGINAGDDASDMGAYGGAYPIDDSEIPSEIP